MSRREGGTVWASRGRILRRDVSRGQGGQGDEACVHRTLSDGVFAESGSLLRLAGGLLPEGPDTERFLGGIEGLNRGGKELPAGLLRGRASVSRLEHWGARGDKPGVAVDGLLAAGSGVEPGGRRAGSWSRHRGRRTSQVASTTRPG